MSYFINILLFLCLTGFTDQKQIGYQHRFLCKQVSHWCFSIKIKQLNGVFRPENARRFDLQCVHGRTFTELQMGNAFPKNPQEIIQILVTIQHNCTANGGIRSITNQYDEPRVPARQMARNVLKTIDDQGEPASNWN